MTIKIIILLLLSLVLTGASTLPQKPINKPSKTQQSLPKPTPKITPQAQSNATEHETQSVPSPESTGVVLTIQPFDQNITALPDNFVGHNIQQITDLVLNRRRKMKRDEFETTEQFQKRLEKLQSAPLAQGFQLTSSIAFITPSISVYDADKEVMQLTTRELSAPQDILNIVDDYKFKDIDGQVVKQEYASLSIQRSTIKRETYMGSNAYGAKVEVLREYIVDSKLAIVNWLALPGLDKLSDLKRPKVTLNLNMSPDKARQCKNSLRLLIVGNMFDPLVGESFASTKPTLTNPIEALIITNAIFINVSSIWVFDQKTGEIIARSNRLTMEEVTRKLAIETIEPSLALLQNVADIGNKGLASFGESFRKYYNKNANNHRKILDAEIRNEIELAWKDYSFAERELLSYNRIGSIIAHESDRTYQILVERYGFPKKKRGQIEPEEAFTYVNRSAVSHLQRAQFLYNHRK